MQIEWSLPLFTVIAGTGASVLVFAGLSEFLKPNKKARMFAAVAAMLLLVVGGIVSVFHLGNPANFMAAATMIFSGSPISMELLFLGLCVIAAIIYAIMANREGVALKVLGAIAIVVGVLFAYFSGHGYEVIAVKDAWATPLLTFSYTFSALTMGGFLFLSIQAVIKDETDSVKRMGLIVLIVTALQAIVYIAYGATVSLGDYAVLFWGVVVVCGGLASAVAAFLVFSKRIAAMAYAGLVVAVVGAIAFRALMWVLGSTYIPDLFDMALNRIPF